MLNRKGNIWNAIIHNFTKIKHISKNIAFIVFPWCFVLINMIIYKLPYDVWYYVLCLYFYIYFLYNILNVSINCHVIVVMQAYRYDHNTKIYRPLVTEIVYVFCWHHCVKCFWERNDYIDCKTCRSSSLDYGVHAVIVDIRSRKVF